MIFDNKSVIFINVFFLAITAYAFQIFQNVGMSQLSASLANIGISLIGFGANLLGAFIVDRLGRRPIMLISNCMLIVINLAVFGLMLAYRKTLQPWIGYSLIAVISLFMAVFCAGPSPIVMFVTPELLEQRAKPAGAAWTFIVQTFLRALLSAVFLPLDDLIGPFAYLLLFLVPLIVPTAIIYFYLPETKNRNYGEVLEEIEKLPKLANCAGFRGRRSREVVLNDDDSELGTKM